jgi:hypothetical protein
MGFLQLPRNSSETRRPETEIQTVISAAEEAQRVARAEYLFNSEINCFFNHVPVS